MRFTRKTVEISGGRNLYLYEFEDKDVAQEAEDGASPQAPQQPHEGKLEPEDFEH